MKKVKPKVIGYIQTGYRNHRFLGSALHTREAMQHIAQRELMLFGIRSRFRPVYESDKTTKIGDITWRASTQLPRR